MIYIQKMILLGTLSVIYAHIKNNIIKDPFYDLHTKNDTIRNNIVFYVSHIKGP
jgi:hypothetical protein